MQNIQNIKTDDLYKMCNNGSNDKYFKNGHCPKLQITINNNK